MQRERGGKSLVAIARQRAFNDARHRLRCVVAKRGQARQRLLHNRFVRFRLGLQREQAAQREHLEQNQAQTVNVRLRAKWLIEDLFRRNIGRCPHEQIARIFDRPCFQVVRNAEMYLIGAHISPLQSASTHVTPDPVRTRKLLLKADEIKKLIGKVEQRGYTLVPLNLHYTRGRVKCEIGLAKGKKQFDKRETEKNRDWQREKARIIKSGGKE